jgi:hypothetical protein
MIGDYKKKGLRYRPVVPCVSLFVKLSFNVSK